MSKFKVGDRVVCPVAPERGIGTVAVIEYKSVGVIYDNWKGGHDLNQRTQKRNGWFTDESNLEKAYETKDIVIPKDIEQERVIVQNKEEYDLLMRILENSGWLWIDDEKPTQWNPEDEGNSLPICITTNSLNEGLGRISWSKVENGKIKLSEFLDRFSKTKNEEPSMDNKIRVEMEL